MTQSTQVKSFSQKTQPQAPVWAGYKQTLIDAGVLDLREQRPIAMKAVNVKNLAENNDDDESSSRIITKIIHFQRHGQGYHNLLGDIYRQGGNSVEIDDPNPETNPFVKPEIQDSPLTMKGRQEAAAKRDEASTLTPEIVVVSPLQRAVQTALLSFQDHYQSNIPFIAHQGCREQLGLLTCNKALPLSQAKAEFPQIDFSLITHGEDDSLWNKHPTIRELPLDEADRAYNFLTEFIMNREEKELAVVCHSAWLFSVCNAVIDCDGDESLESWFGTGEIRSMSVSFHPK